MFVRSLARGAEPDRLARRITTDDTLSRCELPAKVREMAWKPATSGLMLPAELEHVGGFLAISPLAVEAACHSDGVGGGGAGHLELAIG